jgi:iron-sulfur cluster repair protein YtfE (RIC family)
VTPTPAPAPILKPTPPTGGPSRPLPPKTTKAEETKPVEVASNAEQNSSVWKEAFEQLQEQFTKFQNDLRQEMQKEIDILAKDLDNERKKTAQMEIDIDRLKKSRDFRDNI